MNEKGQYPSAKSGLLPLPGKPFPLGEHAVLLEGLLQGPLLQDLLNPLLAPLLPSLSYLAWHSTELYPAHSYTMSSLRQECLAHSRSSSTIWEGEEQRARGSQVLWERVLGVSPDFITPQLCDLGKFCTPFWAFDHSPEKIVSDKLCSVGLYYLGR